MTICEPELGQALFGQPHQRHESSSDCEYMLDSLRTLVPGDGEPALGSDPPEAETMARSLTERDSRVWLVRPGDAHRMGTTAMLLGDSYLGNACTLISRVKEKIAGGGR